ncbi:MAG: hypothetical protein HXY29_14685, partial [Rhodocyclaceae bacterium]|nr:hypothetical protein [Rhodocyclaceae bacterium]
MSRKITRRQTLLAVGSGAASLAAGVTIGRPGRARAQTSVHDQIRLAMSGCGGMGTRHM